VWEVDSLGRVNVVVASGREKLSVTEAVGRVTERVSDDVLVGSVTVAVCWTDFVSVAVGMVTVSVDVSVDVGRVGVLDGDSEGSEIEDDKLIVPVGRVNVFDSVGRVIVYE